VVKHHLPRIFGLHDEWHVEIVLVRQAGLDEPRISDLNINACLAQVSIHTFRQ